VPAVGSAAVPAVAARGCWGHPGKPARQDETAFKSTLGSRAAYGSGGTGTGREAGTGGSHRSSPTESSHLYSERGPSRRAGLLPGTV
jgi:hypothetical protein